MADFPYTLNTGKIGAFLSHIQSAAVPPKLTQPYLESVGFKSKNDRNLISVMKSIGFIDGSGVPTERWTLYRSKSQARLVLGEGIREGYKELFATYPDAHNLTIDQVRDFMSAKTKVGSAALKAMLTTFRSLCSAADFSGLPAIHEPPSNSDSGLTPRLASTTRQVGRADVHIEIKVELPAESSDPEIYDKIFGAMKKHLLSTD